MEAANSANEAVVEVDDDAVRFEDLTVDDDLPILERVVRYSRSQIALQRLVHVKMLAETAEIVGQRSTQEVLIPLLRSLVSDPESIIRQHVSTQLVPVCIVCMVKNVTKVAELVQNPVFSKDYDEKGYSLVTTTVLGHINTLLEDFDMDVRRAAADALSGLALQIRPADVPQALLQIPLALAAKLPKNPHAKKKTEADQHVEELRITAGNLLAELGGAASEHSTTLLASSTYVSGLILPAVLKLCDDVSFRVRRSAAQALPRILGACSLNDVEETILPAFDQLSRDDLYRVRKSTGECLVDMSRSMMLLAASNKKAERTLYKLRRETLIPIADRLIQDSHKMVRQGMMQFLGPFMASFYPYQTSALRDLLPGTVESDGSNHMGIVAQFFPHATSMVSRLNSAQNISMSAPTPVNVHLDEILHRVLSEMDVLHQALPAFLQASRMSALSLAAVATHRNRNLPDSEDVDVLIDKLLDYFAALAIVSTGDENTDAEMRVYCAYSFPALILLLGADNWEGAMRTCFFTLMNPNYAKTQQPEEKQSDPAENLNVAEPPLPVKRCLASSLHTVANILGPELAASDIVPVLQDFFLKDPDESVRLNVIRNFPALLQVLSPSDRKGPFLMWSEIVRGEELLGIKKRSAHNPVVLNWRQRDYLARSLPDLIGLVEPSLVHEHIWPIMKTLLTDAVSIVRDDAIWSIAMILKAYCLESLQAWPNVSNFRAFSAQSCAEVIDWLKESILKLGVPREARIKPVNFSERQLYCRICATLGLALRFSEQIEGDKQDPVSVLSGKFKTFFFPKSKNLQDDLPGPYQAMTKSEQKHLRRLLLNELLPPALEMKEDRISNVRVTLMKTLQLMPAEIRATPLVQPVLQGLVEEVETWENFAISDQPVPNPLKQSASQAALYQPAQRSLASGAVSPRAQQSVPVDLDAEMPDDRRSSSDDSSASAEDVAESSDWKTVVFQAGPIGMQLEPTADDRACRVYGFLDSGDGKPSPARHSGKIELGDVIVKVNGKDVHSYDDTIAVLKAGGRREITFRQGTADDDYDEEEEESVGGFSSTDDETDRKERERKAKKEAKKAKKAKKETKKKSRDKKKDKRKKEETG
jgi:hypothetical protein